jgi:capsular polysaccharide biosynthesis protein
MSTNRPATDLGIEREIDLRKWRDALISRWWVALAGLVVGVVIGALYGLTGGSAYDATALIAPGQAFNPSGNTAVQTYLTSQTAINTIATSNATLEEAAAKVGLGVDQLRGHVTTAAVNENADTPQATTSTRKAVLVQITVELSKKKKAEDAANAIAAIVQRTTTSPYVRQSIKIIASRLAGFSARLVTLKQRIDALNKALVQPGLSLDAKLLLAIQADQAEATYNQTQDAQLTAQQQQILSEQVEQTQIIQGAKAQKTTARSRRNSVVVGALIGLILGAIVATYLGLRGPRPAAV